MVEEVVAFILLVLRIAGSVFLFQVLKKQIELLRRPIKADPSQYNEDDVMNVWNFRRNLHYITIALFVGNFIPIVLDSLVVLQGLGFLENVRTSPVIIVYAVSNAVTMLLAAILINSIYKLAIHTEEVTDLEMEHLRKGKSK